MIKRALRYLSISLLLFPFGAFLNHRAQAANDGLMPTWGISDEIRESLPDGRHSLLTAASNEKILSDVFPLYMFYQGHFQLLEVVSIGDLLIDLAELVNFVGLGMLLLWIIGITISFLFKLAGGFKAW